MPEEAQEQNLRSRQFTWSATFTGSQHTGGEDVAVHDQIRSPAELQQMQAPATSRTAARRQHVCSSARTSADAMTAARLVAACCWRIQVWATALKARAWPSASSGLGAITR